MLKRCLRLVILGLVLLPLCVTAVTIGRPVTTFSWQHDGANTEGYYIECDGEVKRTIPDNTAREAKIADIGLADGLHSCLVAAYNGSLSAKSRSLSIRVIDGQAYKASESIVLDRRLPPGCAVRI